MSETGQSYRGHVFAIYRIMNAVNSFIDGIFSVLEYQLFQQIFVVEM